MNTSYMGFNENVMTVEADENLKAGDIVTINTQGVATPAKEGDAICGYCTNAREGFAAVQFTGFVKAKCAGAVTAGMKKLGVDAQGRITEDAQGRELLVMCADTDSVGFIL